MGARRPRKYGRARKSSPATGSRYLRPRLPDGTLGKVVPIEFFPRYSTLVAAPDREQVLLDLCSFRRVAIPRGRNMTVEVIETDDTERGWDGRPARARRRKTAAPKPRRKAALRNRAHAGSRSGQRHGQSRRRA
jgi:hypothetical protein